MSLERNMKINKKISRYLLISLCIVIIGGIAFSSKTYGNENIPSVGEFYELELELEENQEEGLGTEEDIYSNEYFSEDEINYGNEDFNYDNHNSYDDDYNYDFENDDYGYDNIDSYDNDYNNSSYDSDDYYLDNDDYNYDENFGDDNFNNNDNEDYFDYGHDDYNYDFSDFDYSVGSYNDNSYDDYTWGYSEEDFGFLDYYFGDGFEEQKEEYVPGSKFLKTPKTIQYTFDLNSKYPRYIDTGVRVQEDETVNAEGIKEVFKQIAVRKNVKFMEDTDRVMILIDGKIIVAEGDVTKIETLEKLFEETPVEIKAQDTRAGGKFNLADYLERNGEVTVEVNGEEIELIVSPKLDNSRVLFPIRSIGEAMGAKVEWNSEKAEATIEKDDKVIKIEGNSDRAFVNDEEHLLSNKTYLNDEERRILSILNLIVTELDGEMKWNSAKSMVVIETPQEEVNLDEGL